MECQNNATRLRREVLIRIARAFVEGRPGEAVDRIPHDIRPKTDDPMRCCIYKDRAVLRYRCMAALGFAVEDEADDFTPLAQYTEAALERGRPEGPVMTVLDVACQGCVKSRHMITDACRGCVARPCAVNCPFDAIRFENGRASIDTAKCVQCGKCREVCPFHAVTRIPVPCEEACPVGAIKKADGGKAHIDTEKCISCGRCMRSCPFGAIMEKSQIVDVLRAFRGGRPVVAMIAPAIAGQFPGDLSQIAEALVKAGFARVVEVAHGADETARREAHEFVERMERGEPFMTTSCCPAYIEAVRRHLPELANRVSDTATPMHYTAEWVRANIPEAVTVFIGPCVAKRVEGMKDPAVDYVLTFEELGAIFVAKDIDVCLCAGIETDLLTSAQGRAFAVAGGVAEAVAATAGDGAKVEPVCISGLSPAAMKTLRGFAKSKCPGNLVEVMACECGCVSGAGVVGNARVAQEAVRKWAETGRHIATIAVPDHATH